MAVVRCPMCGKPNPVDGETCWNCDARLKPLVTGEAAEEISSAAPEEEPDQVSQTTQDGSEWQSESELPDWLQVLRQEEKNLDSETAAEGDSSGWLPEETNGQSFQEEPADFNWLSSLSREETQDSGDKEAEAGNASPGSWNGEDTPGWLKDLSPESEPGLADIQPPHEAETPEWVHLDEAEQGGSGTWMVEDERAGSEAVIPSSEEKSGSDWDEPEWLRQIQTSQNPIGEGEEIEQQELSGLETPKDESGIATQFESADEQVPGSTEADIGFPFLDKNQSEDFSKLPIWLASFPQDDAPPEEEPDTLDEEPEEPGELSPGNLPTWLESMRPVENTAPNPPSLDEGDRQVEGSGPLSGLKGVLPFEPAISQPKKPPAYSVKLQVTENQQAHAATFEELIRHEGEARPVPSKAALSSLTLLRWIIFTVLFLGIGWGVWTASQDVPLPEVLPEIEAASRLVNNLPGGAPVLLAIDYQPGLSAEMDAASAGVIDQLMSKGVYLALVSTTPSGPLQGARLVSQVNKQGGYSYTGIDQFANLGFIPGGTAGLRGFAEAPDRILPFSLEGNPAWQATPLKAIQGLKNFALVTVVTENPETAQAWIEQVQPLLGQTPLLLVVSNQADPVVRPYYEAQPKQVQGLVTGLAGGASFEGLQGRPGLARKYWDSFSLGLFLAVLLIVIGGVASLVPVLLSKRNAAEGEGKA